LETADNKINFCALDPARAHVGGRLVKVRADGFSMDALKAPLLDIATAYDTPFINI
jgi:hypothetical protein